MNTEIRSANHLKVRFIQQSPVQDEDVEKLSPLQCGHINMQGRYSFTVPESVSKGELRAFNEEM